VHCPSKCGLAASTVARTVKCKGMINNRLVVVADSWCTDEKPANSLSCPATSECVTYNWTVSSEECPTECGKRGSVLTRTVRCIGYSLSHPEGVVVADTFCKINKKPKTLLVCCATAPCAPFWWTSNVSCPTKCGLGEKNVTRNVRCKGTVNGQLIAVANSWCSDLAPSPIVLCPATPLCASPKYSWKVSDEACPTACGLPASVVQRTVTCVSSSGAVVADSFCDSYSRPSSYLNCSATPLCQPYEAGNNTQQGSNNNDHNMMPLEELAPLKDEPLAGSHKSIIIGGALGATLGLAGIALCVSSKRRSKAQESLNDGMIDA